MEGGGDWKRGYGGGGGGGGRLFMEKLGEEREMERKSQTFCVCLI